VVGVCFVLVFVCVVGFGGLWVFGGVGCRWVGGEGVSGVRGRVVVFLFVLVVRR